MVSTEIRDPHALYCDDPSLTKQSFAKECDINNVIKNWTRGGVATHVNTREAFYGDFTSSVDYHYALNSCIQAEESFMTLPAELRARFNNDPSELLSFLDDSKNEAEAIELGLVTKPGVEDVKPVAASEVV